MARAAGAKQVYMASAAPTVRYQNVYGIDMPTQTRANATAVMMRKSHRIIGADYPDLSRVPTRGNAEKPCQILNPGLDSL